MTATRAKAARTLTVLANPIPGLVRAVLTVGRAADEYVFARRAGSVVSVRKIGAADEYLTDLDAGTCSCKAGQYGRVAECRHVAAGRKLSTLGYL